MHVNDTINNKDSEIDSKDEYPPVHHKIEYSYSFTRLDMLYERYSVYRDFKTFTTLEELLSEHESYQKDFTEELREEYLKNGYEKFLIQLSWSDLPYRMATKKLIEKDNSFSVSPYVKDFLSQFDDIDLDRKACFLFPEM